jgi:hypothetical protein
MGVAPACARAAAGTYSLKYRRVNVQRATETSASSDRRAATSSTPRSPRASSHALKLCGTGASRARCVTLLTYFRQEPLPMLRCPGSPGFP